MDKENIPKISIVILNYNGLKYLVKTLPAVLRLSYPNIEVIVVDNASADGSLDFIRKYATVKCIANPENYGYSKGKNIGLRHATGKYILYLDEDILIDDRDILTTLLNNYDDSTCFLQVPLVDVDKTETYYYGIYYSVYGANMHRRNIDIQRILRNEKDKIEICGPTGGFFFVSSAHMAKLGDFDESQKFHIDDVDIGPRSWIFGYKNYLLTKTFATHLGVGKVAKLDNFVNRFSLVFSGHARAMVKNYNLGNLLLRFPVFFAYQTAKAIKFSITKMSLRVFFAFVSSVVFFVKTLPDTLKQRKYIQAKRVCKNDIFLDVRVPKFK